MARRVSDIIAGHIEAAIDRLDVPQAVKDQMVYDIVPSLMSNGSMGSIIGIGLPAGPDWVFYYHPAEDPFNPEDIYQNVVRLVKKAQDQAATLLTGMKAALNGHSQSGLYIP